MRFVCDACQDITNIEADRMEIQGEKLMVYSRGRDRKSTRLNSSHSV